MTAIFRSSALQRHLWRHGRHADACVARAVVRIQGPLDRARLERALQLVTQRHEIFRTTFVRPDGASLPMQEIDTVAASPLRHLDLLRRSESDAILVLTVPATYADAVTLDNLVDEIARAYESGTDATLTPLADVKQYADVAEWHNQLLEDDEFAAERGYWAQQPAGQAAGRILDERRSAAPFVPRMVRVGLPRQLPIAFDGDACALRRSFFLACWQTLLWRLSGDDEVVVGVIADGRAYEELRGTCGLLARTLPVAWRPAPRLRFRQAWAAAAAAIANAEARQDYFDWDAIRVRGRDDQEPYCVWGFEFEGRERLRRSGRTTFEMLSRDACTDRFTLKLSCGRAGDRLNATLSFDAASISKQTAKRIAGCLRRLADHAASDPDAALDALDIVDEREVERVRTHAAGQDLETCAECAHALFDAQASRTPSRNAIVSGGRVLTYAELRDESNTLAEALARRGFGPERPIALCMEPSPELVVGILGILKAGAAYVPLDPANPPARLASVLRQAGAGLVVTRRAFAHLFDGSGAEVHSIDDLAAKTRGGVTPIASTRPGNVAYIIFTSGSTGTPKGVAVTHDGLVQSTLARLAVYRAPVERFLLLSPVFFDSSVVGLFWTLFTGGTIVLPPGAPADIAGLASVIAAQRITHWLSVPSLYARLLAHAPSDQLSSLDTVIVAGEPFPASLVEQHRQRVPDARLYSEYGPTEGCVWSAVYDPRTGTADVPAPIGRPRPGAAIHILTARMQPVPVGATGELCLGGGAVSRGYCAAPAATAERFVPDPFSGRPGSRLYRTGDVGRYLADGAIEWCGRRDDQIKIRGVRVEPGEVESALASCPGVREAVVVPRSEGGEARLVAYIVAEAATPGEVVQTHLTRRLPAYLLPAEVVRLDALPLLRTGKIDRKALPAASGGRKKTAPFELPRNELEATLHRIWTEVLGSPSLGVLDDFFDAGGDSILSIEIIARATREGLRLTTRQLYDHRTIAGVAAVLSALPAMRTESPLEPVPPSPIQQWFFDQAFAEPHWWNQTVQLEVAASVSAGTFSTAFAHVAAHHCALRLAFDRHDGGWRQSVAATSAAAGAVIDVSGLPTASQRLAVGDCVRRLEASLDYRIGDVARAAWFDRGTGCPAVAALIVHHLVVDAVSWRILVEDLQTACDQVARDGHVRLAPVGTPFLQWADAVARAASRETSVEDAEFWLTQVRRSADPLPVRAGAVPAANLESSAAAVSAALSGDDTKALLDLCAAQHCRVPDVVLTALLLVVSEWTGRPELIVDVDWHGRELALEGMDVSRTVGWFTAVHPIRLALAAGATPVDLLRQIKETSREATRRSLAYALLRRGSAGETVRRRLHAAGAEVSFNYLGRLDLSAVRAPAFRMETRPAAPSRGPRNHRPYVFEISSAVRGSVFELEWGFSTALHERDTLENLARRCINHVASLVRADAGVSLLTPADFPDAGLSQAELDTLLSKLVES